MICLKFNRLINNENLEIKTIEVYGVIFKICIQQNSFNFFNNKPLFKNKISL